MKNIKSLCIRFNLLKNKDKSAWDILHNREREERFVGEIVSAVEKAINKEIPKFLSFCFGEIIRQYGEMGGRSPAPASITAEEKKDVSESTLSEDNDYSDFDIDFMND